VPLTSTLASRVAFQTVNHQGYFTDGHNDADDVAARIQFLYTPSDAVSLLFSADWLSQGGKGPEDEPLPRARTGRIRAIHGISTFTGTPARTTAFSQANSSRHGGQLCRSSTTSSGALTSSSTGTWGSQRLTSYRRIAHRISSWIFTMPESGSMLITPRNRRREKFGSATPASQRAGH